MDAELDRLISRRASQDHRTDPDELEPTYAESVRLFNTRVRAENRLAWSEYHRDQAQSLRRTMTDLVEHHERQAGKLLEGEA